MRSEILLQAHLHGSSSREEVEQWLKRNGYKIFVCEKSQVNLPGQNGVPKLIVSNVIDYRLYLYSGIPHGPFQVSYSELCNQYKNLVSCHRSLKQAKRCIYFEICCYILFKFISLGPPFWPSKFICV